MARLWTSGFESQHWHSEGLSAAYTLTGSGAVTYDTTNKRVAATRASLNLTSGSTPGAAYATLSYTTTNTRYYYFRFYIRRSSATGQTNIPIWRASTATPTAQLEVRLNTSGQLQLYNANAAVNIGSPSSALVATQWYRVEIGVRNSGVANTSYAELKIDGTTVATSTTVNISTTVLSRFFFGWLTAPTANERLWIDDCALNDDQTGGTQTSWPADGRVWLMLPTADSARAAGWLNDNGGTSNMYDALNNTPPVGVAQAPSTMPATAQLYNVTNGTGQNMDLTMQTYTALGIDASETIILMQMAAEAGVAIATARAANAYIVSNPAETAPSTFSITAAIAGVYPTNWMYQKRTLLYAPTVTLGTAPVARVSKEVNNTAAVMFCFAGITIESRVLAHPRTIMGVSASVSTGYPYGAETYGYAAYGFYRMSHDITPISAAVQAPPATSTRTISGVNASLQAQRPITGVSVSVTIPGLIGTSTNANATAYSPNQLAATAANGDIFAVWYDGTNVEWGYASSPYGTWTTAHLLTSVAQRWQAGLYKLANDNVLLVAANSAGNIVSYLFTYTSGTHSWAAGSPVTVLAAGSQYNGGSIAMDADAQGRIWAAWANNSHVVQVYYTGNSGTSWTASTTFTQVSGGLDNNIGLAYCGNYIVCVFCASTALFQYARIDASVVSLGAWSTPAAITNSTLDNTTVSISFHGEGGYGIFAGSGGTLPVQRYDAGANTWSAITNIGASNDKNATLVSDGTNLYCVWCKYSAANNFSLVYKKWITATNTWDVATTELVASGGNISWPSGGYGNGSLAVIYTLGTATPWSVKWNVTTLSVPPVTYTRPISGVSAAVEALDIERSIVSVSAATKSLDVAHPIGSVSAAVAVALVTSTRTISNVSTALQALGVPRNVTGMSVATQALGLTRPIVDVSSATKALGLTRPIANISTSLVFTGTRPISGVSSALLASQIARPVTSVSTSPLLFTGSRTITGVSSATKALGVERGVISVSGSVGAGGISRTIIGVSTAVQADQVPRPIAGVSAATLQPDVRRTISTVSTAVSASYSRSISGVSAATVQPGIARSLTSISAATVQPGIARSLVSISSAIQALGVTRPITSVSTALVFTGSRLITGVSTSPLLFTGSRSLSSVSAAVQALGVARPLASVSVAVGVGGVTRTIIGVSVATKALGITRDLSGISGATIQVGITRPLSPISASVSLTRTRTISGVSTALKALGVERSPVSVSAATKALGVTRDLSGVTGAIGQGGITRTIIGVSGALQAIGIPRNTTSVSSTLQALGVTRSLIGVSAATKQIGLTRDISGVLVALAQTVSRTLTGISSAVQATVSRTLVGISSSVTLRSTRPLTGISGAVMALGVSRPITGILGAIGVAGITKTVTGVSASVSFEGMLYTYVTVVGVRGNITVEGTRGTIIVQED